MAPRHIAIEAQQPKSRQRLSRLLQVPVDHHGATSLSIYAAVSIHVIYREKFSCRLAATSTGTSVNCKNGQSRLAAAFSFVPLSPLPITMVSCTISNNKFPSELWVGLVALPTPFVSTPLSPVSKIHSLAGFTAGIEATLRPFSFRKVRQRLSDATFGTHLV